MSFLSSLFLDRDSKASRSEYKAKFTIPFAFADMNDTLMI